MTCLAAYRGELPIELSQPRPPCFTPDEWDEWVRAEAASCAPPSHSGYCEECTPEYQAAMIRAKKCLHPDTVFDEEDGAPIGIRVQPISFMPRDAGLAFKKEVDERRRAAGTSLLHRLLNMLAGSK